VRRSEGGPQASTVPVRALEDEFKYGAGRVKTTLKATTKEENKT